jgi:RNA polymerase sigma factor (TIGR02999 family)
MNNTSNTEITTTSMTHAQQTHARLAQITRVGHESTRAKFKPGQRAAGHQPIDELFAACYDDLRRLAHARLRRSSNLSGLDTTGLVHESYFRFLSASNFVLEDRLSFLSYASRVMRSIVVDLVRQKLTLKNGGNVTEITLNTNIVESVCVPENEVLRINEALEELATIDERLALVVEMRYFGGLSEHEIAEALGLSTRTVERDWEKAKLFLQNTLQ